MRSQSGFVIACILGTTYLRRTMSLNKRIKDKINGQLKGEIDHESVGNLSTLLEADVKFIAVNFAAYAVQHPELEMNQLFDEWFQNHFNDPIIETFE
jgi:hypothetical protein